MADDIFFDTKLDGSGYGQTTGETCWYACYEMLFGYMQRPISSIKDTIVKAGFDFSDYYKNGLPIEDYRKVGLALHLTGFRGGYISGLVDNYQGFADLLQRYGPMWCAFSRPSPHIVVVCGVNSKQDQIHIMNPWNRLGGFDADGQYLSPSKFHERLDSSSEWVGQCPGM